MLKTYCITLPETPERHQAAEAHFKQRGVLAEFVFGIHAQGFGILGVNTYERDHPGTGYVVGYKHTGLNLSHYLIWTLIARGQDERALVLEDDAEFPEDWNEQLNNAITLCSEFDILLIGSCNCGDKPKTHLGGSIWRVEGPQCTHAMIVTKSAAKRLIAQQRRIYAPIDIALHENSYSTLKVVTCLPRIVGQRGIHIEH